MMLRNTSLRWHRIATSLLLSHVVLIRERLLLVDGLRHVARVHLRILLRHARAVLLGWEVLRGGLFWGVDGVWVVDAILSIASGFGSVQASLETV